MTGWVSIAVDGAAVTLDPTIGKIRGLSLGGIVPLHTAHWVGGTVPADMPAVDRSLAGDFFCMPFGASGRADVPPHGWTANSPWTVVGRAAGQVTLALDCSIQGATVRKEVSLRPGEPVLYQRHMIDGGSSAMTYAHHPMFRLSPGDRMAFSPKRAIVTAGPALEAGRNWLAEGVTATDLTQVPARSGTADLTRYPTETGHEDFVTLVEAADTGIGWTAITRHGAADIIVILKDLATLPLTMLWISNGGRDAAPWNGQHRGVLGVEDGCAPGAEGLARALSDNAVARAGGRTGVSLGASIELRHAIAAVRRPANWDTVQDVVVERGCLGLRSSAGAELTIPFDGEFFGCASI